MRIYDNSLTPEDPKMPDFKVSTIEYSVENGFDRLGMGREDEYFGRLQKNVRKRIQLICTIHKMDVMLIHR